MGCAQKADILELLLLLFMIGSGVIMLVPVTSLNHCRFYCSDTHCLWLKWKAIDVMGKLRVWLREPWPPRTPFSREILRIM